MELEDYSALELSPCVTGPKFVPGTNRSSGRDTNHETTTPHTLTFTIILFSNLYHCCNDALHQWAEIKRKENPNLEYVHAHLPFCF